MNKYLTLFACILFFISSHGQDIELAGGINKNEFYDGVHEETASHHFTSNYITGKGYAFSLSYQDTIFSHFRPKFAVSYDHYTGSIYTRNGSLGQSSATWADVEKTVLGLNVYPLNFNIEKILWLNFGAAFNFLLDAKMTGYHSGGTITRSWYVYDRLEDNPKDYINAFTFGLIARMAFEIKVSDSWSVLPQYLFYLGLTNEFKDIEANTKSWRHYFEIGIAKRLKVK